VSFIRQYDNASVVVFNQNWLATEDENGEPSDYSFFELALGELMVAVWKRGVGQFS